MSSTDPSISAASPSAGKPRKEFRNINVMQLAGYRLPLAGVISILHRVSGALMFLIGMPLMLYLFQESLTSELSFDNFKSIINSWFMKLILLGFIWSFCHHFCCGIRYLMLDMHKGLEKEQARNSAIVVLVVSLLATAAFGLKLFGVV
jgi:succinate dehydrogenase / fumarate reductase, cytochrome b subunit